MITAEDVHLVVPYMVIVNVGVGGERATCNNAITINTPLQILVLCSPPCRPVESPHAFVVHSTHSQTIM